MEIQVKGWSVLLPFHYLPVFDLVPLQQLEHFEFSLVDLSQLSFSRWNHDGPDMVHSRHATHKMGTPKRKGKERRWLKEERGEGEKRKAGWWDGISVLSKPQKQMLPHISGQDSTLVVRSSGRDGSTWLKKERQGERGRHVKRSWRKVWLMKERWEWVMGTGKWATEKGNLPRRTVCDSLGIATWHLVISAWSCAYKSLWESPPQRKRRRMSPPWRRMHSMMWAVPYARASTALYDMR